MRGEPRPGLRARPPVPADHGRVLTAVETWWGGLGGPEGARQRAALLPRLFFGHFSDTSTVVEARDARLIGFLIGFLSQARPETAYIHFVGVDAAERGGGLGRWMYASFAATAVERGARVIRCITSPGNRGSVSFHTRMGFTIEAGDRELAGVPVQVDYDGPGLDRVSFVRAL